MEDSPSPYITPSTPVALSQAATPKSTQQVTPGKTPIPAVDDIDKLLESISNNDSPTVLSGAKHHQGFVKNIYELIGQLSE